MPFFRESRRLSGYVSWSGKPRSHSYPIGRIAPLTSLPHPPALGGSDPVGLEVDKRGRGVDGVVVQHNRGELVKLTVRLEGREVVVHFGDLRGDHQAATVDVLLADPR